MRNTLNAKAIRFVIASTISVVLLSPISSVAHDHPAYSHEEGWSRYLFGYQQTSWMERLDPNLSLGEISIPGTHESLSLYGTDIAECQSLDIEEQLLAGIRAFDIRLKYLNGNFEVWHGPINQEATFEEDVFPSIAEFLTKYPTETVLIYIAREDEPDDKLPIFGQLFANMLDDLTSENRSFKDFVLPTREEGELDCEPVEQEFADNPLFDIPQGCSYDVPGDTYAGFALKNQRLPTVGEARGKIVLLQNFYYNEESTKLTDGTELRSLLIPWKKNQPGLEQPENLNESGLVWSAKGKPLIIQNAYDMDSNWELPAKFFAVKNAWQETRVSSVEDRKENLHFNFLSGSVGSFPYFVASGHSSPWTSAPRLATGCVWTDGYIYSPLAGLECPAWYYEDMPLTTCLDIGFSQTCTVSFEGLNTLFYNEVINEMVGNILHGELIEDLFTGIVMADFPGRALIDVIIRTNFYQDATLPVLELKNLGSIAEGANGPVPADPYACGVQVPPEDFIVESESYDPNGGSLVFSASPPGPYNPGTTMVVITATSETGSISAEAFITVADLTKPDISCPDNFNAECSTVGGVPADSQQLANFFASFSAFDACDSSLTIGLDKPEFFQSLSPGFNGVTTVSWSATDDAGNQSSCSSDVTVIDTMPPQFDTLSLSRSELWPANNKMVEIEASISVSDICDAEPTVKLISIESSDQPNRRGGEKTTTDIVASIGTDDREFLLRAERSGDNPVGRTYTIVYEVRDFSGNTTHETRFVRVPHDRSAKDKPPGN